MYLWTNDEIEKILIQLDEMKFPFLEYSFCRKTGKLNLLGRGGYALIYEAGKRGLLEEDYAIKVIGFGDKCVDSEQFERSVWAQRKLNEYHPNIVKVYDYVQIWVQLNDKNQVIKGEKAEKNIGGYNRLRLQFVVMEKLEPVLWRNKKGELQLYPPTLKTTDWEAVYLTHHIGSALAYAHRNGVLHRDVKLENVFFCRKTKQFKLGDFGIAKVTSDGLASTIAFTKGYGAPEVVKSLEDKYNNTADIYSLGMMLFVLLNDLKFPGSDTYGANVKIQYTKNFLLPESTRGSREMCSIARKMCMYNPQVRYQSMEEVLLELDKIIYSEDILYQKEHRGAAFVLATVFFAVGVVLSICHEWSILQSLGNMSWIIVTLFSLAYILYTHGALLKWGNTKLIFYCYKRKWYWRLVKLLYILCIILGYLLAHSDTVLLGRMLGKAFVNGLVRTEFMKVGISGLLFCLYWKVREWLLKQRDLQKKNFRSELAMWRQIKEDGLLFIVLKIKILEFVIKILKTIMLKTKK